eukprot:CAMPEP_0173445260 /NCGR_PEP_ID=MMETSP1357-20121228/33921_1 /TAXON_ID=77926 /ORGANISM="Hemiselmis rufescens, Strain PCC563" /LENGTH=89 /DNA_ID=CAMNT_0014411411 /DNA_START=42 /DNA_END=311 /DNA_ORIENTATION=+
MARGKEEETCSAEERANMPSFDPSDDAISDLTVEQLLDRECERQVELILGQSRDMQAKLRCKASEAKELLLQNPTKANATKLEALMTKI